MRPELPSGRVTLLFTDVEGSTKLLHSLGAEAYAEALAEHRRVIRDACAAEGGVEVDTQGDAFFFAFATAPGALQAASAFTDGLASGPIQVRVGLHTGTPLVTDEGYVGDDVHLAARVAATSHGGQVVLSEATAELVEAFCTDLGEHRLKDIAAPVSIFQLGDASFPPLKTISNTNLPRPASSFLGREAELHDVLSRIGAGARLVALTGPGGTGKTRLAIEAASTLVGHYTAGVFWIGLAPVRDPALVIETIAHVLGAKDGLAAHIGERDMLLLLDNLEHLIEAATGLSELLQSCPNLTLLVTSRELVRIQGEVEYPVPPLATEEAVELFCARSGLPPTEEIAELCSRLDSLPLSVELAAARTKALTVSQILERLSGRLDLLKGGRDADPRQQTLRATIEWSYDLLQPAEQALFARLSVFAGGCTLDAAEEVVDADLDTLQSLVEKSLLRFSSERYWMLQTIRELAEEKLAASGSADERRRRHAKYYLGVGRSLGLTMENLERTGAQRHDLAILEQNNFRAAIDWAFGADLSLAVEIAFALENFWVTHDPQEGIRRFDAFLARSDDLPVELRAAAHRCRGNVTIFAGDRLGGVEHYEAARAAYREAGDEIGTLLMEHRQFVNREVGDLDERRQGLEALLARSRALGMPSAEVQALSSLAGVMQRQGDVDGAAELLRTAAEKAKSIGFAWTERSTRESLARTLLDEGEFADAREEGLRALELARQTGDRVAEAWSLTFFTMLAARTGDNERAGLLWGALEAEAARKPLGIWVEDRTEAEAGLPLDDRDFGRGRERGRRLTYGEALDEAAASID